MACLRSAIKTLDVTRRDTKSGIPSPFFRFVRSPPPHVIRIAFVHSFKACFCFVLLFRENASGVFSKQPCTLAISKKKKIDLDRLIVLLRELLAKFQVETRKIASGKACKYSATLSAGPARITQDCRYTWASICDEIRDCWPYFMMVFVVCRCTWHFDIILHGR